VYTLGFAVHPKSGDSGRTWLKATKRATHVAVVPSKNNATPTFKEGYPHQISSRAREAMPRKLVWIERQNFQGYGCSECAWVFNPSGAPTGKSLDEMKQNYEQQCDKHFAEHACTEHPRGKDRKS
jgi:hypothetical protein